MKLNLKLSLALIAGSMMAVSCGGSGSSSESTSSSNTPPAPEPIKEISLEEKYKDDPIFIRGVELMKQNDCPSCHMIERKIVGPSYADVAAKYETTDENVEMLAGRVIAGNVGVWGEIPMPAHPALSKEDAEDMVRYVLLLKK
ncbi:cytochrome c [Cyclobacterium xiamenense]|uniref:Cytochrome c n=1 Tax=Cyclobacterium xiamenense TaxID=1297121 RepID=A0A1H6VVM9_9BACT|nr:c-type cytochrome [Cyclobacterium xiamenense]SEJ05877.1 cytochrome c [Cyclobacterium xiamenense]